MPWNLHVWQRMGCSVAAALLIVATPAGAQRPCSPAIDSVLVAGWRAYRADSIGRAEQRFTRAHRACSENLDASVGLGFVRLRRGDPKEADRIFTRVLARDSTNSDAWEGITRTSLRLGDTTRALAAGRRVLGLSPQNREVRVLLTTIAPDWDRPGAVRRPRATSLQLVARTRERGFEVASGGSWRPFYIKGVNLGVALPGRYPSEFPADSATYAGWLATLAGMNANTVRIYTILPPAFYRALRAWNNSHPDRHLWLIHGVWTELPPKHEFKAPAWQGGFQQEMQRVVDVIHGAANLDARRGHAAGSYDADVSAWVLAYIIGREWEPFAVKAFDQRNRAGGYSGRYLRVQRAPAMDLWLAQQCDFMLTYEVERYNALRPIAYTNWPTLDPLRHLTEATIADEARWRKQSGRRSESGRLEYENDVIGLDANLVQRTAENPAGWFASYHAYPYYPDFMNLDPGYRRARSSEGPSNYFGYLSELVRHHPTIPLVIAEYGVPSSRGNAHLQVQGWSHGGHDERAMAAIDARLTREIREAGAAGAILFAWMDEWFKKNWAVMDYEIPLDNTRMWHNVMDAEQHYGILGQYAGDSASTPQLGGDPTGWRNLEELQRQEVEGRLHPHRLRAGADESFWYIALELAPGPFPWSSHGMQLAVDTYQPRIGQHTIPRTRTRSELGFEFLIDLLSPDSARIRVTPDYNRHDAGIDSLTGDDFGRFSRRPVLPRNRQDGRFDSQFVIINRARFGRDGQFYSAHRHERGRLRFATQATSTLADWYLDEQAGLLELRIPWDLLNVTDPSTRTLLADGRTTGDFGVARADAFHIGVEIYRKGPQPQAVGSLPRQVNGVWVAGEFAPWRWRGWTAPRSQARLKPVYDSLRLLWREARDVGPARLERKAPSN